MKIKVKKATYESVMALKPYVHKKPKRPNIFFKTLIRVISGMETKKVNFSFNEIGMEKLKKEDNALILMNHSAFLDLEIASKLFYPRSYNIICGWDGFVGKDWLMRCVGCIPTMKFIPDGVLVKDILYAVRSLHNSILMYPEATYCYDGTSPTPLPESLGKLIKLLKIPVVLVRTYGAFQYDPLYNLLKTRKVDVSADVTYLLSPEDIKEKSAEEINALLKEKFTFNHFQWQKENGVKITEDFRADGLESVLYKCPICGKESMMEGKGTKLTCHNCSSSWTLEEDGSLSSNNEKESFSDIPSWSAWERKEVEKEIDNGSYHLDVPVKILIQRDTKALYDIGYGRLEHCRDGFHLTSDDGKLDIRKNPLDTYSSFSDLYWYQMGDMIGVVDDKAVYSCFPPDDEDIVYKTRMATEYIYKLKKEELKKK